MPKDRMPDLPHELKEAVEFLKQTLDMQMDGDRRVVFATVRKEREKFAIVDPAPVIVPIPFHVMKEAVAQIITYEVEVNLSKLDLHTRNHPEKWPQGLRGAKHVAKLLMDAAQLEAAGQAVMDEEGDPHFKPRLEQIL